MEVRFFKTASGAEPVRAYLRGLSKEERRTVGIAIRDIQEHGLEGSTVTMRSLGGKLWELKIDAQRIFYMVLMGPTMVLLSAYRKQGQKTPRGQLEVARSREKEALSSGRRGT